MTDVFTPPEANLHDPIAEGEYGSIENAIEGRYAFGIRDLLSESWANIKGYKRTVWLGMLVYFLIIAPVQLVITFTFPNGSVLFDILESLVLTVIGTPVIAGLYMLGIKRSVGAPVAGTDVVSYFNKTLKLTAVTLLMYLLIIIGLLLFVLPGIYLTFAYMMALPLAVEKDLGIWETLEVSRKAVTKRWFKFFGLMLITLLILTIAALPLGIGLIWAIPLVSLAFAMLYRNMFGVEAATMGQ